MSNKKRPTTQRVHTRASKEARQKALDMGVQVVVNGKVYEVRAGDISAADAAAMRRETGMPFAVVMQAMRTAPDIDLIAAVVWLHGWLKGDRETTFEEIAAGMNYGTDVDVDVTNGPEEVDGSDPEA